MESHILPGYFDYNATTPVSQTVADKMSDSLRLFCNASSSSSSAKVGKHVIAQARESIAKLLNCNTQQVAFTSGGSEANNWAIKGTLFNYAANPGHVITSSIEHPSILYTLRYMAEMFGFAVTYIDPKENGSISYDDVKSAIRPDTQLISVMYANNETGVIQPIKKIAKLARSTNIVIHTDCVQIVGKRQINIDALDVDLASFSAHKFYGPKGIGGLYIKDSALLQPLIHGGGQEMGLRAGTENLLAIAGLAQAADDCTENVNLWDSQYINAKRYLINRLNATELSIAFNGETDSQLSVANTLNFSIAGVRGEALAAFLDSKFGIILSIGSACSNNKKEKTLSHVLKAMGYSDDRIQTAVRVSLGRYTTHEDIDRFVDSLSLCAHKLLEMGEM